MRLVTSQTNESVANLKRPSYSKHTDIKAPREPPKSCWGTKVEVEWVSAGSLGTFHSPRRNVEANVGENSSTLALHRAISRCSRKWRRGSKGYRSKLRQPKQKNRSLSRSPPRRPSISISLPLLCGWCKPEGEEEPNSPQPLFHSSLLPRGGMQGTVQATTLLFFSFSYKSAMSPI